MTGNAVNSIDPDNTEKWHWCDGYGEPAASWILYKHKGTGECLWICIRCIGCLVTGSLAALAHKKKDGR